MPRVNLLTFFCVSVLVLGFVRGFAAETDAAAELVTAMAKLHGASYRKRDQMQGMATSARALAPLVTEYSGGQTINYTKRAPAGVGMPAFYSVVGVDARTGLPQSEEMFFNGQPMMKSDYFDFGAPIAIELPDCLK